ALRRTWDAPAACRGGPALARGRDRGRADARRPRARLWHVDRGEPRGRLRPGSAGGVAPRRRDEGRGDRAAGAGARRTDASSASGDAARAAPPHRLTFLRRDRFRPGTDPAVPVSPVGAGPRGLPPPRAGCPARTAGTVPA